MPEPVSRPLPSTRRVPSGVPRRIDTVVVGGGQAGLTVGRLLQQRDVPFVIVDAERRTGDAWRRRWDSLVLFTPARFNGLPGLRFPARGDQFVTKDEMADYLESYAEHFELPIVHDARVDRVQRREDRFLVSFGDQQIEANQVVIAMANYQKPRVPSFASALRDDIVQLHSSAYKRPAQLAPGSVLVVGAGNSGADIALELSASHATSLAGTETGAIPFRIEGWFGRHLGIRMVRFIGHHLLNTSTPLGRRVRPTLTTKAGPLVRVKPSDLEAAGIARVARVTGVRDGLPVLGDDEVIDVDNVLWCTGYKPGFDWIDLPVFDERGYPQHRRGLVPDAPGLYFVGLHFQYAATSAVIAGVARDARYVTKALLRRREQLAATDAGQQALGAEVARTLETP